MKQRSNKSNSRHKPELKAPAGRSAKSEPGSVLSSRRKWAFRLFALTVLPLLLLGGLEAALRLAGYGYATSFFKPARIGNEDYFIQNDDFGLRFFPKETARNPGALRMKAHKPPGTFRIFVLGESAAMGDPEPAYGASRYLEVLLGERFPDAKFDVVNVAFTAINSHVIVPIACECAEHGGDLWIVYMGNNEMVGPFGAATVFGTKAPPLGFVRLNLAIQKTRIGQLLVDVSRKLNGKNSNASWGGMQMFLGNQLRPDDPRREVVYKNFERNLRNILQTGLGHGAKIILNTVAVNLRDSPPFASMYNNNLPEADRGKFDETLAHAKQLENEGGFAQAAKFYEQAARSDERFAEVQFRWGGCLLRMTNASAALEHLQLACDYDALPFRADSRINGTIRETGRRFGDAGLVLCDVVATNTADNLGGREIFYEHVHFNFDGNYRLARLWAAQVEKMLPAGLTNHAASSWAIQESCERRLGLTDWNRAFVLQSVIRRLQQPPLSSQFNNAERLTIFKNQEKKLRQGMTLTNAPSAQELYLEAMQHAPEDFLLLENYANFLEAIGDWKEAIAQWRSSQKLIPHDFLPYFQLGRMLDRLGQSAEATASLEQALAIRPSLAEAWFELGKIRAAENQFRSALDAFDRAVRLRPQDAAFCSYKAKALSKLGRRDDALKLYREAIRLNPDFWEAHYELGGELDAANQPAGARSEFAEAVRLNPGAARAHFNFGVLLAKQSQLDEAEHEFAETLRLEPGYQKARDYLAQVQTLKTQKR